MAATELPRILLVDDEADARYLFGQYARRAGVRNQIDIADCGEDAIAYLQQCLDGTMPWPCVVFLDIIMPGMPGFEVLAWIRSHGAAAKTVVVMHSSSEDPEHIRQSFRKGAHGFVSKGQLSRMLKEIVDGATILSPRQKLLASIASFQP